MGQALRWCPFTFVRTQQSVTACLTHMKRIPLTLTLLTINISLDIYCCYCLSSFPSEPSKLFRKSKKNRIERSTKLSCIVVPWKTLVQQHSFTENKSRHTLVLSGMYSTWRQIKMEMLFHYKGSFLEYAKEFGLFNIIQGFSVFVAWHKSWREYCSSPVCHLHIICLVSNIKIFTHFTRGMAYCLPFGCPKHNC